MLNKNPFKIDQFGGLNLGSVDPRFSTKNNDTIPFSDAKDGSNLSFTKEGGIRCRPGVGIRKFLNYEQTDVTIVDGHPELARIPIQNWKINRLKDTDYTNRWLVLEYDGTDGYLMDINSTTRTEILKLTGMKFASVINIFGRLYISPLSDFGTPLANASVYLYDGTGATPAARVAAGPKPTTQAFTVAEFANANANATAGMHLCAIAFETDSGFITPPNTTWKQVTITADTGKSIKFSSIDLGPTGTVARHLLVSKIILTYDNIQENWELFFGLRIADNTTTSGEVILPDTGLVDSADYLLDEYETIPACSSISVYQGRLIYNGLRTDKRVAAVSKVADPETISQSEDYIQIYDGIPADITTGKEQRGSYYLFKESSTYVTNDNGGPPNTWKVDVVDSGMGASPFGIADVMANPGGLVLEHLIIGNLSGIYAFSGAFSPIPLSWKIHSVFTQLVARVNNKYTRMAVDPVNKIIYLLTGKPIIDPDNPTTGGCTLYIGDYFKGLDPENIKWMKWEPWVTFATGNQFNGIIYTNVNNLEITATQIDIFPTGGPYVDPVYTAIGTYLGAVTPPEGWTAGNCFGWSYLQLVAFGHYDLKASGTRVGGAPDAWEYDKTPTELNFEILIVG